jgi:hypothetical protein
VVVKRPSNLALAELKVRFLLISDGFFTLISFVFSGVWMTSSPSSTMTEFIPDRPGMQITCYIEK